MVLLFAMLIGVYFLVGFITYCMNYAIMRTYKKKIVVKELIGSLPIILFGFVAPLILLYRVYLEYGDKDVK